jgi:hypothetical protein
LESQKTDLEQKLSLGEGSVEEFTEWSHRIGEIMQALDVQEMRWLELSEKATI